MIETEREREMESKQSKSGKFVQILGGNLKINIASKSQK